MLLMGHMIGKLNKNSKILAVKYYFYVSIVRGCKLNCVSKE